MITNTYDQAGNLVTSVDEPVDTGTTSRDSLHDKAINALNTNATYLAIASPTNAQVVAQVQALTKECNGIIRLLLNQLDSTAGT